MRVCFIGHQATKEGAARFLLDQADYLRGKGVEVFAVLPQQGLLGDALRQRGVRFEIIASPWWARQTLGSSAPDHCVTVEAAQKMADWFRRTNTDLVYTQTVVAPAGPLGAALAGKPHVWHIHEFSYNPEGIEMVIPKPQLARLIDQTSNLVVFNSVAVSREWEGFLPAAKTKIVYNWIASASGPTPMPEPSSACDSKPFSITIVGSVLPWKRQEDAILALAKLVKDGRDATLSVIGPFVSPAYHEKLVELVRQNRLEDRVRFIGYVESPAEFVKESKVTLMCSRLEPFGRVTVESMALGVPVIGTDSGGTPEIIEDGTSGLLYPVGDVDALAECIERLMQDEPFRQTLSKNAQARAGQFASAEKAMAPLLDQMGKLLGARNPSWPFGELVGNGITDAIMDPGRLPFGELCRLAGKKILRRLSF